MRQLQQKGFSAIEAIIIIVILSLLSGTGWLFLHKQDEDKSATNSKTISSNDEKTDQQATFRIPNNFKTYTSNDGYKISYPDTWGTLQASADSTATTGLIDNLHVGATSRIDGRLALSPVSTVIAAKYGATLQPIKQNNGYIWKVADVNPADTTDKVGDTYTVKSFKNARSVTIYDFQYQDEDAIHKSYVVEIKGTFYQVTFPSFWTAGAGGDPAQISQSDLDQFTAITKNIADSIQIK